MVAIGKADLAIDKWEYENSKNCWHGDFGKPVRDGIAAFDEMAKAFYAMNAGQQTETVTKDVVALALPFAAPKAFEVLPAAVASAKDFTAQPILQLEAVGVGAMPLADAAPQSDYVLQMSKYNKFSNAPGEWAREMEREVPSSKGEQAAFRGDEDVYSPVNNKGLRNAFINADGDFEPADPRGMYKGRKVMLAEHINAQQCYRAKEHSPFMTQRSSLHSRILAWRMDQLQVESRQQSTVKTPVTREPDWQELQKMLKEQTTTRMLFWRKYKMECESQSLHSYQYSQFCRRFSVWLERNNKTLIEPDWEWISRQTQSGITRIQLWREYSQSCALSDHFFYSYNHFCRTLALWQSTYSRGKGTTANTTAITV